jgi:hypothetical protein
MSDPSRDPRIEYEPHLLGLPAKHDPSEAEADERLQREWDRTTDADHVEHTVWDEPGLSRELSGKTPSGELTYEIWLGKHIQQVSVLDTWLVTLAVILAAGPWGIVGALFTGVAGQGAGQAIAVTVFGPVTEEITKIALALWIVEKRPYLFSSIPQILLCAGAGGLAFAAIENLVYLNVYVRDHSPAFEAWRWTVCVGLHVGCSLTAGIGIARIWDRSMRLLERPKLALGVPWFVTAMIGHGVYNGSVFIAEAMGWLKLMEEHAPTDAIF